ncbi:pentapeptide repeat-containing protein [Geminocystis sp. CENA526]|uniref:pentapeptide repeat-containing protein n=1 Tax=Geminocystis sp. CENA526 TaxID=1355871 RepID=UPI003D6EF16B
MNLSKIFTLTLACIISFLTLIPNAQALDYTKRDLFEADFSGQNLSGSTFNKANLRSSNLSNANLQKVSFFGANMDSANLEGADLRNAVLDSARLTNANLHNAILEGAFATNTKFEKANIEGADFTDVILRPDIEAILCQNATGTNPTTLRNTHDTLYCE